MAETEDAYTYLTKVFESYGLGSLAGKIREFVQNGYSADTVTMMLRDTPEYQARFPAMKGLHGKGTGFSEADYINFERAGAELEQRYGLPKGTVTDPKVTEKLLMGDVSPTELKDRLELNQAGAMQAPKETRDALERLYGVGVGGLTAYYLDPERAVGLLERQFTAAQISGVGSRYGMDVSAGQAERYAELGVDAREAQAGFGDVAAMANLRTGYGEVVSQEELLAGRLGGDTAAAAKAGRVARSRQAGFAGGGGASAGNKGVSGLGSASS